jgi:NAD(P)-dependent dehydrogenase (short-subunit alcohol dehydrogenase family)
MQYELAVMQEQRHGSIVNISSTMGSRGAAGASLYVASKHAVEGLTKSAALEAAPFNVRRQRRCAGTGRHHYADALCGLGRP